MALDLDPYSHAYTDEEIEHLEMRSRSNDLRINRQLFPDRYSPVPKPTVAETLNSLPGEFVDGHIPADLAATVMSEIERSSAASASPEPVHCNGFDDAPQDVKNEINPLTVDDLKAELDAINVPYEKSDHKAQLRDKLAVAWAAL